MILSPSFSLSLSLIIIFFFLFSSLFFFFSFHLLFSIFGRTFINGHFSIKAISLQQPLFFFFTFFRDVLLYNLYNSHLLQQLILYLQKNVAVVEGCHFYYSSSQRNSLISICTLYIKCPKISFLTPRFLTKCMCKQCRPRSDCS